MSSRKSSLPPALAQLVDTGRGYLGRLRWKALGWVVGLGLAAFALVAWSPIGWVPVIGVAVTAAVVTLNKVGQRLSERTCFGCGASLAGLPDGAHGIVCPQCGALHQGLRKELAGRIDPRATEGVDDETKA